MHQIFAPELVQDYLKRYNIEALFDTKELPFQLWEYAPGEMMNVLHRSEDYLKFVVEGAFRIYAVRPDGSWYHLVDYKNGFGLLGDMEFCGFSDDSHFQEVIQPVRTIELPLVALRETLMGDNRFLRYVLHTMGWKMTLGYRGADASGLEDRLLNYLRNECPGHRIINVGDTAFRLNYSRAQLQRVLRDLTARGILAKEGKGKYRLTEKQRQFE